MKQAIKNIIKNFIPPFALKQISDILGLGINFREFSTYDDASNHVNNFNRNIKSSSKNHPITSDEVKMFDNHRSFSNTGRGHHTVMNSLFTVKNITKAKRLVCIDFGGGGGITYFDNKKFLSLIKPIDWHVCELPEVVSCCKKLEDGVISFNSDPSKIVGKYTDSDVKILLLSGVLMYLDSGFSFLQQLVDVTEPEAIIFDRTAISNDSQTHFFSQYIPRKFGGKKMNLYISYPNGNFLDFFSKNNFVIYDEFRSYIDNDQELFSMRGMLAIKTH